VPLDFFIKLQGPQGYEFQDDYQNLESNSWFSRYPCPLTGCKTPKCSSAGSGPA